MKLTVLVDNNTTIDRYFHGEPGVSYFIECDERKYLFDTGYSDIFLKNAMKMGIKLSVLDGVVITGCSHAGICNIIEYAKKVCNEDRVYDVIGGFHLLNPSQQKLRYTVEYFITCQPHAIYACHCTDLRSKISLAQVTNVEDVGVGLVLEYR